MMSPLTSFVFPALKMPYLMSMLCFFPGSTHAIIAVTPIFHLQTAAFASKSNLELISPCSWLEGPEKLYAFVSPAPNIGTLTAKLAKSSKAWNALFLRLGLLVYYCTIPCQIDSSNNSNYPIDSLQEELQGQIPSNEPNISQSFVNLSIEPKNSKSTEEEVSDSRHTGPILYDSSQFEKLLHWDHVSTAVILVQLKTALFYVTEMCSLYTSSCLLQLDRLLIKLLLTQGLNNHSPPQQLSYLDKMKFKTLPHDTWTVLSNLSIDPDLEYLMWCPACFVMYPDDKNAPKNCSHHRVPKQCGSGRQPIQRFASQNLVDWLARLFCRENIEEALEKIACKSLSPFDSLAEMFDIQDSPIWQEFHGADGKQFTANSGNVVFGMFTDGINPYGNWQGGKCASVTFIIMNIFLVGIAPGPRKPSLEQVNWFLTPVVKQLQTLWSPGVYLSKTPLHPKGQLVSATLIPFFADLLALCRSLGFASHTAKRMCSYCLLPRDWAKIFLDAASSNEKLDILDKQRLRYSVLLELEYWNILDYHVVDSMHNLLLGMLKWHCQCFLAHMQKPKYLLIFAGNKDQIAFRQLFLGSSTDPSDTDFLPQLASVDWGGKWVPPAEGKIIFDQKAISHINKLLPTMKIPTWIKWAIPLPLILPTYWNDTNPASQSLIHNSADLISLVNLALKRSMNSQRVDKYRHHIHSYIKSSLILFPESKLVPNHHMAFHPADCLQRFGPCRAWWSFLMERLMAQVLKSSGNNCLGKLSDGFSHSFQIMEFNFAISSGELEKTYQKNFRQIGNIRSLLESQNFPPSLDPIIFQIRAIHHLKPIFSDNYFRWLLKTPVDVVFSTFKANKKNSAVALKPNAPVKYVVQPLVPVSSVNNPFLQLTNYPINVALCQLKDDQKYVIPIDDILAHCAWLTYKPCTVSATIDFETVAVVCIGR
ncbi:hypothetical protein VP01_175g4 [Puccinia sorghi]|uniref:Uncharacterized protein n=1 Tax=Puccinia sorghi TaxID=27349 RepID=A0A0L6VEZ1_9BASI|nr:hypothetical protein VP01_175g4 [Puccinia sorghi]